MHRGRLLRWLVITSVALAAGVGGSLYFRQPDELETSILGDLVLSARLDQSARVTVLKRIELFDAASHRLDYATVLIRDDSGYRLAHLRRLAQHPGDSGGRWSTVYDEWRTYDHWPAAAEIEQFDATDQDSLKYLFAKGWLPRPPGTENFRAGRLLIRISEPIPGFEPNAGVDAARFAAVMLADQGDSGRPWLGQFTFAPFHNPRWFSPAEGLAAVEGSIRLHGSRLQRARDSEQRSSLRRDLELLRTVEQRLATIQEHGREFYFLAEMQGKDSSMQPL
jgi:hypothetical protein